MNLSNIYPSGVTQLSGENMMDEGKVVWGVQI